MEFISDWTYIFEQVFILILFAIVNYKGDNCNVNFNWSRVRLFDERACLTLYEKVLDDPLATVTSVKTKPKSKYRPVALDTVVSFGFQIFCKSSSFIMFNLKDNFSGV